MLENVLYTLTETSLIAAVLFVLVGGLFFTNSQRASFYIAKGAVLFSVLSSILFYNKGVWPQYFETTSYTTLAYVLTGALTFAWLVLSSKWFAITKEKSAICFCVLVLLLLFCLSLIIKSVNLLVLFLSLAGLSFVQYLLFRLSKASDLLYHISRRYAVISVVFLSLLFGAIYALFKDGLLYREIPVFLMTASPLFKMIVLLGILCPLFFVMGIAPFQFWLADRSSPLILPVAMYFNLVPKIAFWSIFLRLHETVFIFADEQLKNVYLSFGIISILFGVIGANAGRFLRKIFASVSLYQAGVLLVVLSTFKQGLTPSCFLYIETYLLALLGIYLCFYALKSNGEYVDNLNAIRGLSSSRPYVSAALLLFVVVLSTLPPMACFSMQFMMLTEIAKFPYLIYGILLGLLALIPVYLKIVQTVSFLEKQQSFDRVDFEMYVYLLMYTVLLLVLTINPKILMLQTEILLNMG